MHKAKLRNMILWLEFSPLILWLKWSFYVFLCVSWSHDWNYRTVDVLRKETLIILLVASVLLLADLWKRANPKVATTRGEKFPNILVLAWLKTQICVWARLRRSENRRGARARWDDKADALILDSDQKLFYHHSIFLIGEDVLFAQTWNWAAGKHNTAGNRPTWFPADPRQINASRTMRHERGRFPPWPCLSQCHPLCKVTHKLSQYTPWGRRDHQ